MTMMRNKNDVTKLLLTACLMTAASSSAKAQSFAEAFGGFRSNGNTPISIDANTLDIEGEKGQAVFAGRVKVVQNETVLTTSRLTVSYSGETLSDPSAINKLAVSGGLKVVTGSRTATANDGQFNLKTNIVVLTGNVRVADGSNIATGCKLTVNLNSGDAKLQSRDCGGAKSGGRVQLLLTPKSK